nr:TonB-dependent siderophore receptor [Echinimonas agarilytica]
MSSAIFCSYSVVAQELEANSDTKEVSESDVEVVRVIGKLSKYSAVKTDTPIVETARSISIETEQDLVDKGALRLDDAYTYSAGVTGQTYGFATRGDWVKVRGLDVPQYQDSLQSLFGNYNNTRPDIYTLEQVEILKGPASVLYGKGSPGGLVNSVSKRPEQESAHEVVAEVGSQSRKQLMLDSTGALDSDGEWLYRMIAVYRDTETQVDHVDDNTYVLAPSLTWRPTDETELSLLVNYTNTESDTAAQFLPISGTLTAAPNGKYIDASTYTGDPEYNQYDADALSVTLTASHDINDNWLASVNARYTDGSADYQQAWTSFSVSADRYIRNADGSLYKDGMVPRTFYRNDATSEQAAIDARLTGTVDLGAWQHNILAGTQYQDVTTGSAGYYLWAVGYDAATGGPDSTFGDAFWINLFDPQYGNIPSTDLLDTFYTKSQDTTSKDFGFYITDQINYEQWVFTLGMRYDDTETETGSDSQSDDAVSFSAGALYAFDMGLSPYVSFAESFDPVIGNNGDLTNPKALEPMEGEQWEAGVKYEPNGFPGLFTLAYFDIEQTNLSDPATNPGGPLEQQNGKATITGFEFEGIAELGDFTVELNASRLDTESAEGFQLASVPEHQASSWIGYRPSLFMRGFKSGVGVRYVGESYGGADLIRTNSYTVYDMMLGYEIEDWNVALNVRNLFDKEYQATCLYRGDCFPGSERTIVARVGYEF